MRLRCRLFGCHPGTGQECWRCGLHVSDGGYVFGEDAPLRRLAHWWDVWRCRLWPRCDECGKSLRGRPRVSRLWCSEKCRDSSLPF